MKRFMAITIAAAAILSFTSCNKTVLFNGRNLNNWEFFLVEDEFGDQVPFNQVFGVTDGKEIIILGQPYGYMRTKEPYSNYTLHVEYMYPEVPGNSGIFINAQVPPDRKWPPCLENQLSANSAGDFLMINGTDCNEVTDEMRAWAKERGRSPRIEKKQAPAEFIVGDWNKVDIICDGNHITTYVNGVLQNECTGFTYDNGYICLQSEGSPILFKNIWLKKL
ncbi:MAG: DUF1080 domain-containing protein [Bacteroidales bacterium]|nr:DUF1080 domain-containing protein [Bacteroidales bacterium]